MIFEQDTWYKKDKSIAHHPYKRKASRVSREAMRKEIAEWDKRLKAAKPQFKQIKHLITKFGGVLPFSLAVGVHPNKILWNWLGISKTYTTFPKARYGILNNYYLVRALRFARHFGVVLTPEDIFPDIIDGGLVKNPMSHPELLVWLNDIGMKGNMKDLENTIALLLDPR